MDNVLLFFFRILIFYVGACDISFHYQNAFIISRLVCFVFLLYLKTDNFGLIKFKKKNSVEASLNIDYKSNPHDVNKD